MKTLWEAVEKTDMLVLTYLKDYPDVVEGKVLWRELYPIDSEVGLLGKVVDGEVIQLDTETKVVNLTQELREKMLQQQEWMEITTESGQDILLPPQDLV